MADLTQIPGRNWKQRTGYLQTPWAVFVALLGVVALLDPRTLSPTINFAARAVAHTRQYIIFEVLQLAFA